MPYGNLTIKMRDALTPYVLGKIVHDLGAGDCDHARTLIHLGASRVIAIDKHEIPISPPKGVDFIHGYIERVPIPPDLDVIFLSWPVNYYIPGLLPWLSAARTIVYLGTNLNGSACGFVDMFKYMLQRKLCLYMADPRNNLIVVQDLLDKAREPTLEEQGCFAGVILRR